MAVYGLPAKSLLVSPKWTREQQLIRSMSVFTYFFILPKARFADCLQTENILVVLAHHMYPYRPILPP